MAAEKFEVDYLIVGAGAMGMAFADIILSESDKTVLIVDMHHKPGGHWNDAYPYVTLHQPSGQPPIRSENAPQSMRAESTSWSLHTRRTSPGSERRYTP